MHKIFKFVVGNVDCILLGIGWTSLIKPVDILEDSVWALQGTILRTEPQTFPWHIDCLRFEVP